VISPYKRTTDGVSPEGKCDKALRRAAGRMRAVATGGFSARGFGCCGFLPAPLWRPSAVRCGVGLVVRSSSALSLRSLLEAGLGVPKLFADALERRLSRFGGSS
jgi:hypothetical protein